MKHVFKITTFKLSASGKEKKKICTEIASHQTNFTCPLAESYSMCDRVKVEFQSALIRPMLNC